MNFGIRVEQNEVVVRPKGSRTIAALDEAQILIILEERNARVALKTPQEFINRRLWGAIVDDDHLTL